MQYNQPTSFVPPPPWLALLDRLPRPPLSRNVLSTSLSAILGQQLYTVRPRQRPRVVLMSRSLSPEDRRELGRLTKILTQKVVQVVVQSRLGEKAHTRSKSPVQGSDWVGTNGALSCVLFILFLE